MKKNFKHYMGHSWSGNIGPVVWILEFGSLAWGYLLVGMSFNKRELFPKIGIVGMTFKRGRF